MCFRWCARTREETPISMEQVRQLAAAEPTPLSLRQMRSFADGDATLRILSAKFLHKELQARFARYASPLELYFRRENSYLTSVGCCSLFRGIEPLRKAKARGSNLVPLICYGLHELKRTDLGSSALQLESVQEDIKDRLDKFFLGRIGIRMLIGHHVESLERAGGRVHLVSAEEVVRVACDRARKLCEQYCGVAPPVEIHATASVGAPFMYVQSHLHHMVSDGLHIEDVSGVTIFPDVSKYRIGGELPPVQIVLCMGSEDLTVKVSDEGGGVPRSRWNKLWHYDYTTSPPCPPIESDNYHSFRQHFSGGGYGLPIARLFARYFGGEITFSSLEGSGSTAFVQAHRLGTNMEVVPGHASFSLQPLYS
ncbi:hypothetical protein BBJ28_00009727 [Nothophytophthora sp. Chile5]|nr:hypothetical protein BBJ28_00009727 [Nothophytophthora sp. Chile5]